MSNSSNIQLQELNPHLMCVLCGGYLIDATTIIECLHSFCRTCIIRYLESSKYCPICDVQVHKTRPLENVRSDKTLQTLVYKLVPGLFKGEMKRRKDFYAENPEAAGANSAAGSSTSTENKKESEVNPASEEETLEQTPEYSPDPTPEEMVSLCLQHCDRLPPFNFKGDEEKKSDKRFLLCPSEVSIGHIKKFLQMKFELPQHFQISVFHADESLANSYTLMDIASIYTWRRMEPLKLYYTVWNGKALSENMEAPSPSKVINTDQQQTKEKGKVHKVKKRKHSDSEPNGANDEVVVKRSKLEKLKKKNKKLELKLKKKKKDKKEKLKKKMKLKKKHKGESPKVEPKAEDGASAEQKSQSNEQSEALKSDSQNLKKKDKKKKKLKLKKKQEEKQIKLKKLKEGSCHGKGNGDTYSKGDNQKGLLKKSDKVKTPKTNENVKDNSEKQTTKSSREPKSSDIDNPVINGDAKKVDNKQSNHVGKNEKDIHTKEVTETKTEDSDSDDDICLSKLRFCAQQKLDSEHKDNEITVDKDEGMLKDTNQKEEKEIKVCSEAEGQKINTEKMESAPTQNFSSNTPQDAKDSTDCNGSNVNMDSCDACLGVEEDSITVLQDLSAPPSPNPQTDDLKQASDKPTLPPKSQDKENAKSAPLKLRHSKRKTARDTNKKLRTKSFVIKKRKCKLSADGDRASRISQLKVKLRKLRKTLSHQDVMPKSGRKESQAIKSKCVKKKK